MQDNEFGDSNDQVSRGEPRPFKLFREVNAEAFIDRYDTKKLVLGAQRHVFTILLSVIIWTILGGMLTNMLMNTYKADAVVIYQEEDKPQTLPGGYTLTRLSIATVLDMIKLPVNFQGVKSVLGLDLSPGQIDGMVDVPTPRANSNLIHIIARGENPHFVVDIANTLARVAVKNSQDFFQKQLQAALQSYNEQLEGSNQKMAFQLQEIQNFKKENQYFEMTADYVGQLKLTGETRNRLQSVTLQYNSLLVEYENLKREVANLPDEVPVSSSYGAGYHYSPLEAHLGSLQGALAEARSKYTEDNPKVKQIEEELDNLLKQSRRKGSIEHAYEWNTDKTKLQIEILRMEGKVRATLKMKQDLTALVANLERDLESLPAKQITLSKLLYGKEITEEQQRFLYGAIESVQLMLNIPAGSIDIYSLSQKAAPLRDGWWVQTLPIFGLLFGFGFGFLLAIIMEMSDTKFRTAKEIELHYNLPCLGVIPMIPNMTPANGESRTLFFIRLLAERLEWYSKGGAIKSVAFTNAFGHGGKSEIAYYYALYCKKVGMKVVFLGCSLDSDLFKKEKPALSLESYLQGKGDYNLLISEGEVDSIRMTTEEPAMKELVKSEKMRTLWARLSSDYDVIVVNTPGVIEQEYAINLVHFTEMSVFVVDSSTITKSILDQSLGYFEHFHVKPTGILLNKVLPVYIEDERVHLEFKKNRFKWLKKIFSRNS